MTETPAFYDDLAGCLAEAWRRLEEGAAHQSGFHTPALATIGRDGAPRLRTVVLRGVDRAARSLRVHCDARSAKAAEIAADPGSRSTPTIPRPRSRSGSRARPACTGRTRWPAPPGRRRGR